VGDDRVTSAAGRDRSGGRGEHGVDIVIATTATCWMSRLMTQFASTEPALGGND